MRNDQDASPIAVRRGRVRAVDGGGLECEQELGEQGGQVRPLRRGERREQRALIGEVKRGELLDEPMAGVRELDEAAACVGGIRHAGDQPGGLQPVQAVGHRARGAHQPAIQLRGRRPVRGSRSSQRGEDIPTLATDAVDAQDLVDVLIKEVSEAPDPRHHVDRFGLECRPFAGPLRTDACDMVRRMYLHVKIVWPVVEATREV